MQLIFGLVILVLTLAYADIFRRLGVVEPFLFAAALMCAVATAGGLVYLFFGKPNDPN